MDSRQSKKTYDWLEYTILTVCRKLFPSEKNLVVKDIEPRFNRIFAHQDYEFCLVGDDTECQLILRLHHGLFSYWGGTEKIKTAKVFSVMRFVYQHGIPAPFPYDFNSSHKLFGWPYILLDPGDGQRWWEHTDSLRAVQNQFAEPMAEELAKIHTHVNPEHPLVPRVDVRSLVHQLEERTAPLHNDELQLCFSGCKQQLNEIAGLTPVLLHGHYDLENMLLSNDTIRTITNWEHSAIGDPRWDLAHTSLYLERDFDRSLSNRFLAKYVQITGTPAEDIAFWEGLIALRSFAISRWVKSLDEKGFQAIMGLQTSLFDQEEDFRKRAMRQFT